MKVTQEGRGSTQTLQTQEQASCWPWLSNTKHVLVEYRSSLQRLIQSWQAEDYFRPAGMNSGSSPPISDEQIRRLRLCIDCWPISSSVATRVSSLAITFVVSLSCTTFSVVLCSQISGTGLFMDNLWVLNLEIDNTTLKDLWQRR